MTKDVCITINGLQLDAEEEPVIMTVPGTYHLTNGKHYIHYEEIIDGSDDISKNTIKISSERIVLMKKGAQIAQLIFDLRETEQAIYQTPYGSLFFETDTKYIDIQESEDTLQVQLEYTLFTEDTKLSDNRLTIKIEAK